MARIFHSEDVRLLKSREEMTEKYRFYLPKKTKDESSQRFLRIVRSATANVATVVGDFVLWTSQETGEQRWYRLEAIGKTTRAGTEVYTQDTIYYRASLVDANDAELSALIAADKLHREEIVSRMMSS